MEVFSAADTATPVSTDEQTFLRNVWLAVYRSSGRRTIPPLCSSSAGTAGGVRARPGTPAASVMIWLQVRDVRAEHDRLAAAGVRVVRKPVREPWGLVEMWIEDPDGVPVVLVEVPLDHPLRPTRDDLKVTAIVSALAAEAATRGDRA